MCSCTGPGTSGSQMGKDTPAMVAGHAEPPAVWAVGAVSPDPGLCSERAGWLQHRHCHFIQCRGRATQSLQGQETIRQKAHAGVVVKAGPRATLEMVQAQLLLQLLVALLHVPAALPQPAGWTARSGSSR